MTPKAGIFDPYLDTLGGGERYCLTVAEILSKNGFDVDIFWSGDQKIISKAEDRFNLDLSSVNLVPNIFSNTPEIVEHAEDQETLQKIAARIQSVSTPIDRLDKFIKRIKITRQYQVFFYLSDWSIPLLFSSKNLLHIQVPFVMNPSLSEQLVTKLKTLLFKSIICNSEFTLKHAQKHFGNHCCVIYPPVDVDKFSSTANKKNQIISVGRFDNLLNSKKQEVLIDGFKKLHQNKKYADWKLLLVGGSLQSVDRNTYLQHLQYQSQGLPVEFIINPGFDKLCQHYSQSKIYWHAAGYDVDQKTHPESTEHFGMAPVEAMASGCVPILVDKGGLPEIVIPETDGYLWSTIDELAGKTSFLIDNPQTLQTMSSQAIKRSKEFTKEKFSQQLLKLVL